MRIIVKQLCTLRRRRPPEHDRVRANPAHVPPSSVLLGMVQSFVLMVIQLVLAGTTSSTVLLYVFALSFLALCGYVYLLAQLRQRDAAGWNDGWLDNY